MQMPNRRAARTVLQTLVAVAAVVPALAVVIQESAGLAAVAPWLIGAAGTAAGIAGGLARVMALPAVEQLLDRCGLGLQDDAEGRQ
ncbi:hypothetical protein [Streptomyces salyersiae]|uniref:Holin n=1 Tax=Streptomyces salyersiae TaxID=3075530 RepID=A0ABU2RVV3_9ACTN|nr:hypothetical protein [Streptomyces sp. DSM 41770]MDT0432816.1 hypothetical protein [Streptomyces sp. DSM 41770]